MSKKLSRSQARCEAFKLIFELNQHRDELDFLFDQLMNERPESVTAMPYIKGVVTGVMDHEEELLDIISKNLSSGWRIERISKVARAVLLLAVYEIKYVEDVPEKVAINEALELAKKFDEPDSSAFVNGVLAGVIKK
ncbi:MAG: transcription antitermination factor NusB [Clostridiales bacterium]|nr:transcription antitermination factor NusB [Clostridiales bacterium]